MQIIARKRLWKEKSIDLLCSEKPAEIKYNPKLEQWYSYVLDIVDTKIFKLSHSDNNNTKKWPKSILAAIFCNKEMKQINLKIILKSDVSIAHLLRKMQLQ